MKDLMEKNNFAKPLQIGKIVEGKIIGKAKSALFLDLGALGAGIIFGREFQLAKHELKGLKIGDSVFAKVIDLENEEGYIELSLNQASSELAWGMLFQKKDKRENLTVRIQGANKGGLLADVSGIPAFLPVSQLMPENYPRVEKGDSNQILKELQKFVGKDMEVKIFDLDAKQGKLILSERAKEDEKIKEILKLYNIGDVVDGEITGITDFGVFIKFGREGEAESIEGLIHISELDWQLIEDPAEVVKVGEKVQAKIISIVNDKVSLSLKALKKDPWEDFEKAHQKGDFIEGKVSKFNPFGAFVQILPSAGESDETSQKIQGLCHISEFGSQKRMQELLQIGGKYKFEILLIEPKDHKMSLRLKTEEKPAENQ